VDRIREHKHPRQQRLLNNSSPEIRMQMSEVRMKK
jgi:hypothetical protein